MFIAAHLDDRYEQGCINLENGAWESWGTTPFYANHAPDVPFVWGRGAGWMAAGMALLLTEVSPQAEEWHVVMGDTAR